MNSTLRFTFAVCLSLLAHSPSFAATESAAHPQAYHAQQAHWIPSQLGEGGPVAEDPRAALRPSPLAADRREQPPVATTPHDQALRKTPSKVRRTPPELPPAKAWFGWAAVATGGAAVGFQIAAIIVGVSNLTLLAALMIAYLALSITAIALGSVTVTDRASRTFTPGLIGLLLGTCVLVWPALLGLLQGMVRAIVR
jgi:hypothetical protein